VPMSWRPRRWLGSAEDHPAGGRKRENISHHARGNSFSDLSAVIRSKADGREYRYLSETKMRIASLVDWKRSRAFEVDGV
jgi:hypothetical protein